MLELPEISQMGGEFLNMKNVRKPKVSCFQGVKKKDKWHEMGYQSSINCKFVLVIAWFRV